MTQASGKTFIGDISLFQTSDADAWEEEYQRIINPKYQKGSRNFSKIRTLPSSPQKDPTIFVVPRVRGGPSYKNTSLIYRDQEIPSSSVAYCAISKGFGMQDVSSFTIGPVVGEGLCLVNAAFSKIVCPYHLEGGGLFNPPSKAYWKRARKPTREVIPISDRSIKVDGVVHRIEKWLEQNKKLWYPGWKKWSMSVAMSSDGNFHWDKDQQPVTYIHKDQYLNFVEWKKECYVIPAYELLEDHPIINYLRGLRKKGWALGLVHPMALTDHQEALSVDEIRGLFLDDCEMACMPYVVAGYLLGVDLN